MVTSKFNRVGAYTYRERPHRRDARISKDQWHGILLQGQKAINWFSPSPSPCCLLGLQCAGICDCAQDIKQKRHVPVRTPAVPLRTSRDTDQEKPSSAQNAQDSITGNLNSEENAALQSLRWSLTIQPRGNTVGKADSVIKWEREGGERRDRKEQKKWVISSKNRNCLKSSKKKKKEKLLTKKKTKRQRPLPKALALDN